jgi:hypothetical protein
MNRANAVLRTNIDMCLILAEASTRKSRAFRIAAIAKACQPPADQHRWLPHVTARRQAVDNP